MDKIQLISNDNGWGLTKDIALIRELLEEGGFKVDFVRYDSGKRSPRYKYFANIHIELVGGKLFRDSRKNILIPNPEWFLRGWVNSKGRFSTTLCKTDHAVGLFNHLGFRNVKKLGFTTTDIMQPNVTRKKEFLHMAGNSIFKGTVNIIKAWNRNPQWPKIHIFNTFKDLTNLVTGNNIEYHFGRVMDLTTLQNQCFYHLQPSEAEGYGHVLNEALATNSLLITTDAPPMNEIENCLKIPATRFKAYNYGWRYTYTIEDLEKIIDKILETPHVELMDVANKGRTEFVRKDKYFRENFVKEIINAN